MLTKEDLESWNELFPDCKIQEEDLSHPTELFVTRNLVAYLGKFGYQIEVPYSLKGETVSNTKEKRQFIALLVQNIDRILEINDKSYTFTVFDVMRPTTKKTSFILRILLNYLYYFNMCKKNTFEMASSRLKMREELAQKIQKVEEHNEIMKKKDEKIKRDIIELGRELPIIKSEIEVLQLEKEKQLKELNDKQKMHIVLENNLEQLKQLQERLKNKFVSEHDVKDMQKKLLSLQQNMTVRTQSQNDVKNSIMKHTENIKVMETMIKYIDEAFENCPVKVVNDLKEITKNLTKAETHDSNLKAEREQRLDEIKRMKEEIEDHKKEFDIKEKKQKLRIANMSTLIKERKEMYNDKKSQLSELIKKEKITTHIYQQSLETQASLKSGIAELFFSLEKK